jgi:hypothetical protein
MFINAVNRAIESGAGLDEVEKRINQILIQMRSAK